MLQDKLLGWGHRLIERNPWYLAPLSWLYALAVFFRNGCYDRGWLFTTKVPCTVVSVGNILAGGTGKTPFVLFLAEQFPKRKVAILSRGYGTIADEAILLARRLPHCRIYVGKDRLALAKIAAKEADLILLDDGFQYRRLERDFDLVLHRKGKSRYLPWGFLRDSPRRLNKADRVFEMGREFKMKVRRILNLQGEELPSLQGKRVAIFSAIARPEQFQKTVRQLGAEIIAEIKGADHAVIPLSKLPKAELLLCTEKDAVKLPPNPLPIYFLEMELEWVGETKEWQNLVEKIEERIDNRLSYERHSKNSFT